MHREGRRAHPVSKDRTKQKMEEGVWKKKKTAGKSEQSEADIARKDFRRARGGGRIAKHNLSVLRCRARDRENKFIFVSVAKTGGESVCQKTESHYRKAKQF